MKTNPNYVIIFDTTLRDGEQSPGATLTSAEKLEIAHGLARLGVDVIEAGFPAASPDDLEAVRRIAIEVGNPPEGESTLAKPAPVICGLARATKKDIDKAWEAVRHAQRPRIHTFLATSPIHMEYKLKMTPEEVVARVREMVAYAKSYCEDVQFSPEDAGRSEPEFLYRVLGEAIKAGATTLNIPDTVGYTTPEEFGALIAGIMANVPGIENVTVAVHCHDDLGHSVSNSLMAVQEGVRQVECTINGIGERAGNASLEEIVMTLQTRASSFDCVAHVDTTQLFPASQLLGKVTGIGVQPNKAIVGKNAFAHEAGIHQDGVLKNPLTYEIMTPESVGVPGNSLVLGKHSGRNALNMRLKDLGFNFSKSEIDQIYKKFIGLADVKKEVVNDDLISIVSNNVFKKNGDFVQQKVQNYYDRM